MTGTRALVDAASAASSASADWLVRTSWQAGLLIVAVVVIQLLLGHKRIPPKWAYALWMLVVVRLLMPAVPQSPWSVFNLKVPSWARGIEEARSVKAGPAAKAATPRNEPARIPTGLRVTVGIIEGPERHVTSSVVVAAPENIKRSAIASTAPSSFDWKLSVVIVWLAGVAIALACVLGSVLALRRRIRNGNEADSETLGLLGRCCCEIGLSKRSSPRVLITDAVSGPALFGFFRPVLLLPPHLLTSLSREELRFVLLHELAHLRRRDPLANALLVLASAVHWFNPLVRFALARLRAERELACDELVMSRVDRSPATNAPASEYGQAVLRVAQALRPSARRVPVAAVGMIHTRSQLRRRIAMIATYTPPAVGRRSSRLPRVALPVLLVLLVASCALTDGATKPATKPSTASGDNPAAAHDAAGRPAAPTPPGRDEREATDRQTIEAETAMRADLDRTLPELKFDAAAFSDVMESLRDQTHLNLLVDWRALESAGIDRNTPVTTRVRNVKFSKALRIILDHVGGDTVKLGYAIDGNVLNVSTADALAKDTVTRVYDIRDLIIEIPNFTEAPNFSIGDAHYPQSRPSKQPVSEDDRRAERIKEITDLVKETVDADSWRENGGSVGSIRVLQGQLIVTQTQENQNALVTLLEQLRESRAVQITVETRFLTLDPAKADESVRRRLTPSFENGGGNGKPAVTFLSDDDVQAVLRASRDERESTIITAPRVTLFNGQRAFVKVATQRAYVNGFNAVKGADGQAKWEPTTGIAESGIDVDVEATVSADRNYAVLTMRPKLFTLDTLTNEPFEGPSDAPKGLFVQVPHVQTQSLLTTVSIPDRQTILLGGFADSTSSATTKPSGNIYMLVKPTIIVQREIQAKDFRRGSPKD